MSERNVDHPDHYRSSSGHEAIDVIEAWELGFNLGNTIKYISRHGIKDPARRVEDLEKARWYLDWEITRSGEDSQIPTGRSASANTHRRRHTHEDRQDARLHGAL